MSSPPAPMPSLQHHDRELGAMGVMWGKNVVSVYIRPQRYTKEFIDANEHFTCAFFGEGNQREALSLLGKVSGRDVPDQDFPGGAHPC